MNRLKIFVNGLANILTQLRTNEDFKTNAKDFVSLAKSPFVKSMIGQFQIDLSVIDMVFDALLNNEVSLNKIVFFFLYLYLWMFF